MSDATCAICATGLPVPVICTGCATTLRRNLDTVGRLRAQLDPTPGRTGKGTRASGKPGSKPPANVLSRPLRSCSATSGTEVLGA